MSKNATIREKRISGALIVVFLLLCFYMLYILITQQGIISANNASIYEYSKLIEAEREVNISLTQKCESMLSEKNIEKWAREKLGLVKPGEKIFVAVGE